MNRLDHNSPLPATIGRVVERDACDSLPTVEAASSDREEGRLTSEIAARSVIEKRNGRSLNDKEWNQQKRRLIEFVLTLERWDESVRDPNQGDDQKP